MQKDFKKEFSFLTPNHQRLLREETMKAYQWKSRQAFYKLINGKRKITNADSEFLEKRFKLYFQIQKETGRIFLNEYVS